jgi:hypothetical protein
MAIYVPEITRTTIEWLESKGCKSKRDFTSKMNAKEYCKSIKKRTGARMYPYQCVFCEKWHISRSKPRDD